MEDDAAMRRASQELRMSCLYMSFARARKSEDARAIKCVCECEHEFDSIEQEYKIAHVCL